MEGQRRFEEDSRKLLQTSEVLSTAVGVVEGGEGVAGKGGGEGEHGSP